MSKYTNTISVPSVINEQILLGNGYAAGELFEGVADTNIKQVVIENISTDEFVFLSTPRVNSGGQAYSTLRKNVSIDTDGDAATTTSKRTDTNTSDTNLFTAGDNETGAISGGESFPTITSGGGSNASNAIPTGTQPDVIAAIIAPGDTVAIEAQNKSGGTQDISITTDFVELPEKRV